MGMGELEDRFLGKIERHFAELRDELLTASHEFAKSENRDWGKAERLFAASKRVDELCRTVLAPITDEPMEQVRLSRTDVNGAGRSDSANRKSRKKSKKDYPKYTVRSDALIKIGLSRDRRTEYEHTVPRSEFDTVMHRLGELAGRKHFSAEEVIDKVPCSSYQAYIVISLLKEHGLLAVPRRGVYAFTHPKNFLNEAENIWDSLEQHHIENAHK
jgi:hypothetical protein